MKQQTPDKPKPRVSLVGADDLKKMREEEGLSPSSFFFPPSVLERLWPRSERARWSPPSERKFEQRAREYLLDEDEDDEDDEEDLAKQVAHMKATGKVLLDGVEYKVEPISSPSHHYNVTPQRHSSSSG